MKYFERLKNIYTNQKQGDIYYRYFTRHISAPITAAVSYTPITPNMATLSMFFFGVIGSIFFSFGNHVGYITGGILFIFLIVADTVDGELARFSGKQSLFGDYFDRLAHYTTNPLMILGLGHGVYLTYQQPFIIYITALFLICYLVDDISRDLLIGCGLTNGKFRKVEKEKLSILRGSRIKLFIFYTASNTAFFHLVIFTVILDFYFIRVGLSSSDLLITHSYVAYFALATISKMFLRLPLIFALRNN